jgi:hypothetical protein
MFAVQVFLIAIGIGAVIGLIREQIIHAEQKRFQISRRIIAKGGPKTKEEYFFLFPDACKTCGSRVIHEQTESHTYQSDLNGVIGYDMYRSTTCGRGHSTDFAHISGTGQYPENTNTKSEVHSFYLTSEQEASIPDEIP